LEFYGGAADGGSGPRACLLEHLRCARLGSGGVYRCEQQQECEHAPVKARYDVGGGFYNLHWLIGALRNTARLVSPSVSVHATWRFFLLSASIGRLASPLARLNCWISPQRPSASIVRKNICARFSGS